MERIHQKKGAQTSKSLDAAAKSPAQFKKAPPFELTAGPEKSPDPVVKDAYVAKPGTREAGFALRHPIIAAAIGAVVPGSLNISTNAVRFSTNDLHLQEPRTHGGEGSEVNAFRHALWQSTIKTRYGQQIAEEVGNAHEINPLAISGNDKLTTSFATRALADESCDLRNNEIGRSIGNSNDPREMNQLALQVLDYFHSQGLWCAEPRDGRWIVMQRRLTDAQYRVARRRLLQLDENGFDEQQHAEYMERIQEEARRIPIVR